MRGVGAVRPTEAESAARPRIAPKAAPGLNTLLGLRDPDELFPAAASALVVELGPVLIPQ